MALSRLKCCYRGGRTSNRFAKKQLARLRRRLFRRLGADAPAKVRHLTRYKDC